MIQEKNIHVVFPESCKEFVRLQANNDFDIYTDPPYVSVIDNRLSTFQPAVCLELGAGIGRMSVYFFKRFEWRDTFFYLQDGDRGTTQYGGIRHMTEDEYYNSFAATREFCLANGLSQFETINSLSGIKKPVDLCYSFAAIGFHWSIRLYLDKLIPFLPSGAHLIFELKAPLSSLSKTMKGTPEEYRRFYDDQIDFAEKHTGWS